MKYIVECFNDQCLLEAFGINPSFEINHKYTQGKGAVFGALKTQKNRIGIIDFDNIIDDEYFGLCKLQENISREIEIYHELNNNNYLIVFKRKIETMFVEETKNSNRIDTARKLGFDNTVGNYHNIKSDKEKLNKLKSLLTTVINHSPNLQSLKKYLLQ